MECNWTDSELVSEDLKNIQIHEKYIVIAEVLLMNVGLKSTKFLGGPHCEIHIKQRPS